MRQTVSVYLLALALLSSAPVRAESESLALGAGKAKLNALLQVWSLNDTSADNDANSNFRVRRAEVKLSGSVVEKTRWFVMFDPAKSLTFPTTTTTGTGGSVAGTLSTANDNKILQDIGTALTLVDGLELVVGQFKIPTTNEGLQSSSELLLPERSYVGRYFGDRREPGAMLDYNPKPFRVRVMASNGQVSPGSAGTNINDTNNSKDTSTRLDYAFGDDLKLGVFSSQSNSTAGLSNRTGGNIQYTIERLLVGVEGVQAKELDIERNGLSTEVAYRLSDELQSAFRYENFQRTTPTETSSSAYTVGLNYFLSGHNAKVQLAYTALNNMAGGNGTFTPSTTKNNGGLTILNIQSAL